MNEPMEAGERSTLRYLVLRQLATVGPAPRRGPSWSEEIVRFVKAAPELPGLATEPDFRRFVERELALLEYEGHVCVAHVEGPAQYRVTSQGRTRFHELARSRPAAAYTPDP